MNINAIAVRAQQVLAFQNEAAALARQTAMPPEGAPDRDHVAYQLFGLAFHHAVSIASHLSQHGPELAASAFALVRPLHETLMRGWWFANCATEVQTARFVERDKLPRDLTLADMAQAIDALPPFQGTAFFTGLTSDEWKLLHSFTHGGLGALAVYAHRPNLDPDFDPDRILVVLDNAARSASMATFGMCWVSLRHAPEATEPLLQQLLAMRPDLPRPAEAGE